MTERSQRRTFAPVVLLGLAGAGISALAGTKPWAEPVAGPDGDPASLTLVELAGTVPGDVPLAGALSLVVLAAWGVVLVTRGVVRRVVAGLAAVAALGVLGVVVDAWFTLSDEVVEASVAVGAVDVVADWTIWPWACLAGALIALVAAVAAVRLAPNWPEMGRKYDAPATAASAGASTAVPLEERSSLDLWKSLDEGEDPTGEPEPDTEPDTEPRSGTDRPD